MTKTTIRGNFPGAPKPERAKRNGVNVDELSISSDPYVDHRSKPAGKYDALFEKMKPGQCIRCPSEKAANVKTAMDKWLKFTGREGYARARSRYPADGQGRVWWLV